MDVREYLLGLLVIITGLAITDMIVSLHGLLRRFEEVKWDWLPMTAALFVFVLIVVSWWFPWHHIWEGMRLFNFLVSLGSLIAVFLAARAVLPDDRDWDQLDLFDHYRRTNRYVWLSLAAVNGQLIAFATLEGTVFKDFTWWFLAAGWWIMAWLAAFLVLFFVQRMSIHRIIVPLMLAALLIQFGGVALRTEL